MGLDINTVVVSVGEGPEMVSPGRNGLRRVEMEFYDRGLTS